MQPDLRKVILWMSGALASFLALAVSIRALAASLTVFEVLAIRNIGGIVILGAWALLRDRRGIGAPRPAWLHLLRNVFHFLGQACWAYGLTVLPVATVFALEFTAPAWTMVLAVLFLGERLTVGRVLAVALGFVGVLVILQPGLGTFRPEALIVLVAAVGFAVQLTTTKSLTRSNTVLNILFWMNVLQLPMYLAAQAATGRAPLILPYLTAGMVPALAALCTTGLLAHVCVTNAFRHGEAILVVPLDFMRVPLVALLGVVLYAEAFDPLVLVGAAITASGIIANLWLETRRPLRSRGR